MALTKHHRYPGCHCDRTSSVQIRPSEGSSRWLLEIRQRQLAAIEEGAQTELNTGGRRAPPLPSRCLAGRSGAQHHDAVALDGIETAQRERPGQETRRLHDDVHNWHL
jgi:hypothetical protein